MAKKVEHVATEIGEFSATHTLRVDGEIKVVSGCRQWTAEQAVAYELNRGKVAEALVACIKAKDNFISDSFYATFGKKED